MEFCPVLVQINHTLLKKEYDAEYLLQVWNRDGQKVYQKPLKSKIRFCSRLLIVICYYVDAIKTWAVSNEHFIYKPQIGDEDFDCFHLVNLKKGNSTLLIKDCINDPTCKPPFNRFLKYII